MLGAMMRRGRTDVRKWLHRWCRRKARPAGEEEGEGEMAGGCVTTAKERISRMPPCAAGKRSSIYRGVTRHRWTGRYEAHLWDKSTGIKIRIRKGNKVFFYLGAYDDEEAAARAYDLAALKYWGAGTLINFPVSDYSRDLEEMQSVSKEDYLVSLRRKSSAFSKGFPKCRVSKVHPPNNQWETPLSHGNNSPWFTKFASGCMTRDDEIRRKYAGGLCMERKIDLTLTSGDPADRCCPETVIVSDDLDKELHALESAVRHTEPYQLPSLGLPSKRSSQGSLITACGILSQSASFKNLKQSLESRDGSGCGENPVSVCQPMAIPPHGIGAIGLGPSLGFYGCNSIDQTPDLLLWAGIAQPAGFPVPEMISRNEADTCPRGEALWRR
ncbi:unnamed protein product [Spirodela intermedia]|uniref:AP2/ERF domain-containing protein n=1 Tax=Spirodela intermedia TaxID=51605 RepID=A0A7I8JFL8_SPIIN|nr:unnamed protein product [Spirodela intermedia]CAA6668978.1 unnamed protein product [Spirodela intermedia]